MFVLVYVSGVETVLLDAPRRFTGPPGHICRRRVISYCRGLSAPPPPPLLVWRGRVNPQPPRTQTNAVDAVIQYKSVRFTRGSY